MTPEQLREAAAVMLAAADGKKIECRTRDTLNEWVLVVNSVWNFCVYEYRIKPVPVTMKVALYRDVKTGVVRPMACSPLVVGLSDKLVSDIVEIEVKDE